jgi:hypothetical protein
VEVLLLDDDLDAACGTAEAYGCSSDLELQLAERRADHHPSDAIAAYRRHLDRALEPEPSVGTPRDTRTRIPVVIGSMLGRSHPQARTTPGLSAL